MRVPEVAVKLIAPVVRVNPLDAVNNPFDVIVPVPVVAIFPDVVMFPSSFIVRVELPLDWISRNVFIFALLSLMIKALAVPRFVRVRDVVWSCPNVNARFLPGVVVIVFPVL